MFNVLNVQNELCAELCAHAAFRCEKTVYRYPVARFKNRNGRGYITDGHRADFTFGLPLDAGFDLHRTMQQPKIHQGQAAGRVA